jgi:predicted kinase
MSDSLFVIIVTGPPGAGKTTLGKKVSQALQLPFISKDDFKDILFETLGWNDRQWSMKLGQASFEILFHILECQLKVNKPAVVETAFIPKYHSERFLDLKDRYGYKPIQIVCKAQAEMLYHRFIDRTVTRERHPGHVDDLTSYTQFQEMLRERNYSALEIEGQVLEIDTTDYETVDYEGLINAIAELIENHQS